MGKGMFLLAEVPLICCILKALFKNVLCNHSFVVGGQVTLKMHKTERRKERAQGTF